MVTVTRIAPGIRVSWSRRYTPEDIAAFHELAGLPPAANKSEYLPDLLVVAPLTKIGGDLDYVARTMVWTAVRPVRPGERLDVELEVQDVRDRETATAIGIGIAAWVRGEDGDTVVRGHGRGIVPAARPFTPVGDEPGQGRDTPAGVAHGDDGMPDVVGSGHVEPPPPSVVGLVGIIQGRVLTAKRTFTTADIDRWARLTGDRGAHHVPGMTTRPITQGLLTLAAMPLVRGDHGFRYRSMSVTFLAPVFSGETVRSLIAVTDVERDTDTGAVDIRLAVTARTTDGRDVLSAECAGTMPAATEHTR